MSEHVKSFFGEMVWVMEHDLWVEDPDVVNEMAFALEDLRARSGRLFLIGNGGGAGNASHAAADFRLKCGIDARCLTDNVTELTARINDDGWSESSSRWLHDSAFDEKDGLLVFSVGGGGFAVSENLSDAILRAHELSAPIFGVVGAPGGAVARYGTQVVIIDVPEKLKTPLVESFQAVIWHALVSHPVLAR